MFNKKRLKLCESDANFLIKAYRMVVEDITLNTRANIGVQDDVFIETIKSDFKKAYKMTDNQIKQSRVAIKKDPECADVYENMARRFESIKIMLGASLQDDFRVNLEHVNNDKTAIRSNISDRIFIEKLYHLSVDELTLGFKANLRIRIKEYLITTDTLKDWGKAYLTIDNQIKLCDLFAKKDEDYEYVYSALKRRLMAVQHIIKTSIEKDYGVQVDLIKKPENVEKTENTEKDEYDEKTENVETEVVDQEDELTI